VGVLILFAIIAALLYRFRLSRYVQPILLPCAKRRKRGASVPYQDSQVPNASMSTNLLGPGVAVAGFPEKQAQRNSQRYSVASSQQPLTTKPPVVQQPGAKMGVQPGLLGVTRSASTAKPKMIYIGRGRDPPSLSAGLPIPPSPTASRNSVSSMHTSEWATSRPSSVGSDMLSPGTMAWPMPPSSPATSSPVGSHPADRRW
jgi:hypothetical protein